jgi:hypothetical protein
MSQNFFVYAMQNCFIKKLSINSLKKKPDVILHNVIIELKKYMDNAYNNLFFFIINTTMKKITRSITKPKPKPNHTINNSLNKTTSSLSKRNVLDLSSEEEAEVNSKKRNKRVTLDRNDGCGDDDYTIDDTLTNGNKIFTL